MMGILRFRWWWGIMQAAAIIGGWFDELRLMAADRKDEARHGVTSEWLEEFYR